MRAKQKVKAEVQFRHSELRQFGFQRVDEMLAGVVEISRDEIARQAFLFVGDDGAKPHETAGAGIVVAPDQGRTQKRLEYPFDRVGITRCRFAGGEKFKPRGIHAGAAIRN